MKNIPELLEEHGIVPNLKKDQFFLVDKQVASKMCDIAKVTKKDRVLEVGPGLGLLTRVLAAQAKELITIEIDKRFEPILKNLPNNVKVIYGDAYQLLNDKKFLAKTKPPTKTISCIPYSQAQNMLHSYTNYTWCQGDLVWLAPASLANKIKNEPILGAYFTAKVVKIVPKTAFYPQPNTTSAIIYFKRVLDPEKTKDFAIYFRRWLYNHEKWKVKNALREGLIQTAYVLKAVSVTKNQARELIVTLGIPERELDKLTNNIKPEYYFDIPKKLNEWFKGL